MTHHQPQDGPAYMLARRPEIWGCFTVYTPGNVDSTPSPRKILGSSGPNGRNIAQVKNIATKEL